MTRQEYLKHKEVIETWGNGAEIEFKTRADNWLICVDPEWLLNVEYRIKPKPSYLELHKKCDLKVGDRVRIVRTWDYLETDKNVAFHAKEVEAIGKVGIIDKKDHNTYLVSIESIKSRIYYPYFVLEKVVEEYVPFDFEDDLAGKVMITIGKTTKLIITSQQENWVNTHDLTFTYQELLEKFTFLDGSPCGKLKQ